MHRIEMHNTISQIVKIFYRFGVWRNEEQFSDIRKMGWKLLYLYWNVCFDVSIILGGLLSEDENESIFLIAVGIQGIVVSVKLTYILWKKDEILVFLSEVGTHSVENFEEFKKFNDKVKNLMKFSLYFLIATMGICGTVIISYLPVFTSQKMLPLNIWFPYWRKNAIFYWTAYAFVAIGATVSAISVPLSIIVWYLLTNCAIKYQILGNQFRSIASTKPLIKKRKISEEQKQKLFHEELFGLIKTHQQTKETIDRLKSCFANLFFSQITTSGICICGSVYVLAFSNLQANSIQTATNVVFLFYSLFDIFLLMHLGNEIKLSSDRLSHCLFESNWIEQLKSCKKCIIILIEGLKQPHELVIGKLYPLTLETFTSILNLAYSMFNILQNLK